MLAGLVLVGGAVVALRLAGGTPNVNATLPPPPLPTTIRAYAAAGVLPPNAGAAPAQPDGLTVTPGPKRVQVSWKPASGASGYDVQWKSGALGDEVLVGEPDVEIDDLVPGQLTDVRVRSVDSYGQRSKAATISGRALPDAPAGADNEFVDRFEAAQQPDPRLWGLDSVNNCAQAGRAGGTNGEHLVILNQCGQASATLRARTPFRLRSTGPELGRFTIDTDAPGESGELDIDLVPGDVAMIDGSMNDPITATAPNVAAIDGNLPPGTIRVRIAATVNSETNVSSDVVQVDAGPGTPTVPVRPTTPQALPGPRVGISVRWDVVLRTDGVEVLRNGVYVGGGNVVPQWTQATALLEFSGPSLDQQREDVNMVGFGGAPTTSPSADDSAGVVLGSFTDVLQGSSARAIDSTATGPGTGVLLTTLVAEPNSPNAPVTVNGQPPKFSIQYRNKAYLATPAVPGTPLLPGVRFPLVARLPASVIANGQDEPITLIIDAPAGYPADVNLVSADLDVTPGGAQGATPTVGDTGSSPGLSAQPELAALNVQVFDASGNPLAQGASLPRGRAVLDVSMDGQSIQRTTGEQSVLAGLAGFEVWLDNVELVAVPTAKDGPAIGGDWRIAFDVSTAAAGQHTIDVRGYGAERGVSFTETFTSFQLGQN